MYLTLVYYEDNINVRQFGKFERNLFLLNYVIGNLLERQFYILVKSVGFRITLPILILVHLTIIAIFGRRFYYYL